MVSSPLFRRPRFSLLERLPTDQDDNIRTYPELLAFNAKYNPSHIFCLQGVKDHNAPPVPITFAQAQLSVERCMGWLSKSVEGIHSPREVDGKVGKAAAVGILMGSDVGVIIYMMALLSLGVPVVLLSARLTPVAIAHLLKSTFAGSVIVSQRCQRAVLEAVASYGSAEKVPDIYEPISYDRFLEDEGWGSLEIPPAYDIVEEMDRNVLILHSSGTTGLPKPIYHPHKYMLGYAACHLFEENDRVDGVNCSTLPLFHGFGLLSPSLALSVGKPFCIPPASIIPTATSTLSLLRLSNARSLMSVPSILEDLLYLPQSEGISALRALDFVVVGGGPIKSSVGAALVEAGVKLLNHMGATEIGAIAPIFLPGPDYDWRYLLLRKDIGLRLEDPGDGGGLFKLIGRPFGWSEEFPVQDLLQCNPHAPDSQFKILGRADDLIVLATGEKVLPRMMEMTVANDCKVKEAIAFGDGRFNIGLIVEASIDLDMKDKEQVSAYVEEIWPSVQAGNEFTDNHGKITSKGMIVVTTPSYKQLARTDKGSLTRKTIVQDFAEEIDAAYEKAEMEGIEAMPGSVEDTKAWLKTLVGDIIKISPGDPTWLDSDDFFELGMDSLQATILRRRILASITKSGREFKELSPDFIFKCPTIDTLHGLLSGNASDSSRERADRMNEMVRKYVSNIRSLPPPTMAPTAIVLLTGSTGSLGSFLLAQLTALPHVDKVICLNRRISSPGFKDLRSRQEAALSKGGITIPTSSWGRITIHEADLKAPSFGLPDSDYNSLRSVTHIIHNAWPMDFNRSLESFEPHFHATQNIVSLALLANESNPQNKPRILFTSSVAAVGRYPALTGNALIPEDPMHNAQVTDHFGYPEAKWVCERLIEEAGRIHPGRIETASVRIGQLTGSESSGAWSPKEHFPSILKSSQTIGSLPDIKGTLSWIPVDRAARVVIELLFQSSPPDPIYHLENPMRQPWSDLLVLLSRALGLPSKIIPFEAWLDKVRSITDAEKNPAGKVVKFLEEEFTAMASGAVVLDTRKARRVSRTLAGSGGIESRHVDLYVKYWRSVGHLS
ncbi:unnamed protein product [Tuber melanosporum]|uniref:(Perigord truffle) hypothetical protein n=1 Tax=Tuber melanosporum (strain Mel28) TaxID=656061 RepID=D5G9X9_TUBMM|nr:uncharacterized protein GSTUM_00003433001 [Tuber melanosporum]CAZ81322.1 unnamed protein product [Tuber melanosporum]